MLRHNQSVSLPLLALGFALLCTTCSGGGNSGSNISPPSATTATTSAKVVLPSGVGTALSSLQVIAGLGTVSVGSDGSFTVTLPAGGGPATVLVTNANGDVVLLGHVDTANPSFNEVSATSTAEELLFLATGATTLPQGAWPGVYTVLAAAPETATLAGVISTEMATTPTAVGDMDPVIVTAIDTAVASLVGATPSSVPGPLAAARSEPGGAPATFVVTQQASAQAAGSGSLSVLTSPSSATPNPGLGLVVAPSDDRSGIVITNTTRINRFYFVYRTGYVPSTGTTTDPATPIAPWELVSSGLLPSVTGLSGVTSTLVEFFAGKATWAPVNTPTLSLPLNPPGALANTYQVFVVGMGAQFVSPPADLLANGDAQLVRTTEQEMWLYEVVKEILWPLLTKVMPGLPANDIWKSKSAVISAVNNFVKQAGSFGLAWESQNPREPQQCLAGDGEPHEGTRRWSRRPEPGEGGTVQSGVHPHPRIHHLPGFPGCARAVRGQALRQHQGGGRAHGVR